MEQSMQISETEVSEADLFEATGLGFLSLPERVAFWHKHKALLEVAAVLRIQAQLTEQDLAILEQVADQYGADRVQAFFASRGFDLHHIVAEELIRITHALIESGQTFHTVSELEENFKARLRGDDCAEPVQDSLIAIAELDAYIDAMPMTEEQKTGVRRALEDRIELSIRKHIDAALPSQVADEVGSLFKQDKGEEALMLMGRYGVDFSQLMAVETRSALHMMQQTLESL